MPELPEVETVRRDLDRELCGKRITKIEAVAGRWIRRHLDAAEFASAVLGATVPSVARRGKYLLLRLDGGGALVVHLGMSGQLLLATPGDERPRHTHVVLTFDHDRELRFVDPRTFGEMFVIGKPADGRPWTELAHLGVDPLLDLKGWTQLAALLQSRRSMLKGLLLNQRFLAGIGNIYADEILFAARLRYDRTSDTLTTTEVRRLYRALVETLEAAVEHRGSTLVDAQYRDALGSAGTFQLRHRVYGREGQACTRCRRPIARVKAAGRSTFYCPRCQI